MPSLASIRSITVGILLAFSFVGDEQSSCRAQVPSNQNKPDDSPLAALFRSLDSDGDGQLTDKEYAKRDARDPRLLRRDFIVFDANGDDRLSLAEFQAVHVGQPEDQLGSIPDPVVLLVEHQLTDFFTLWKKWDGNADDLLDEKEFSTADLGERVAGLKSTKFDDWDLNHDGQVSREDVKFVFDIAFGVRTPAGDLLRFRTGRVVDWNLFRSLKTNDKGMVSKEEYFRVLGPVENPGGWLASIDKNGDGQFNFAEFALGNHRTDPVGTFLFLDVDLDGRLSLAELEPLPDGWRQMAKQAFRGFDDDRDHLLSVREYQLMPHCNLLALWQTAADTNGDGVLSLDEFHFLPGLPLAALTAEYFRRLDINRDLVLSLDEWTFSTTHAASKFRVLDKDSDGSLTSVEFSAEGSLPADRLKRDFKVLDEDGDDRMSLSEFMAVPYWIPEAQRTSPADPVVLLVKASQKEIDRQWGEWDKNADGSLDSTEFDLSAIGTTVGGLKGTRLEDWDFNRDKLVSREDVTATLEIAFGVRTPQGERLRATSGRVVDWRLFRSLKTDGKGFVDRDEYFRVLGPLNDEEKQKWLASVDQDHDNRFNFAEFALSNHRTDPVMTFLSLDLDLNGRLTPNELEALSADQVAIAKHLFPGFDDDGDGALSLKEFRLTPVVNLLAPWQSAQDTNSDGMLSLEEFRFYPGGGVAIIGLCAEYFKRLDANHDGSLSLDEFPFNTDHPSAFENELRAVFADGSMAIITVPNYPNIYSPKISPDGKWVAMDGWMHKQSHLTAHMLIASLETDEVRDLGRGCVPSWFADGRQIAFTKHGGGVFIRNFEGTADTEELIDVQGFGIQLSPDNLKAAYTCRAADPGNFVIYDIKSGAKKSLFPENIRTFTYIEHNFAWSPDSQRICFRGHAANGSVDICIVNVTGNDPMLRVRCDGKDIQSDFAWHPDGKRIIFPRMVPGQPKQLYEFNPDDDKPAVRYAEQPKDRNNGGMCWSRDGKIFVYMSVR